MELRRLKENCFILSNILDTGSSLVVRELVICLLNLKMKMLLNLKMMKTAKKSVQLPMNSTTVNAHPMVHMWMEHMEIMEFQESLDTEENLACQERKVILE